ncbi:MAG: ANTAR domain-containing protein [Eubacterium sp.]|nr:ANTAR domain-containing protein [Eubacterium sp.]
MADSKRRQHDVLVVSSYEKFAASVERALSDGRYSEIEVRKSASLTRRELTERSYDVAIINIPLSDEPGVDLALDIATRYTTGVIITASSEISEDVAEKVTDYGIIVISKPATSKSVNRSVRLMCAILDRLKTSEKKALTMEEKMEEIRIVNRAKWKLIDEKEMKEDEAHKYIGKLAMDRCVSRREVAEEILATEK